MSNPTPQIERIDLYGDDRGVQVVLLQELPPAQAGALRAKVRHVPGVLTAVIEEEPGMTRIIAKTVKGVADIVLLNRLTEVLQPRLGINMISYLTTLAPPVGTETQVTGIGMALAAPTTEQECSRMAEHFRLGYELIGMTAETVYREGQFFIVSCQGDLDQAVFDNRSIVSTIAEEGGVNLCLMTFTVIKDAPNDTVEDLARRIRNHLSTL